MTNDTTMGRERAQTEEGLSEHRREEQIEVAAGRARTQIHAATRQVLRQAHRGARRNFKREPLEETTLKGRQ
jgi:hypothetical protein